MRRTLLQRILLAVLVSYAALAQAQYQWKDKNGSMVFSDQPPPSDTPPANIIKQPYPPKPAANTASSAPAAEADKAKPAAPAAKKDAPKTAAEQDAEFRKRIKEQAEKEKKAQEEAEQKRQTAESCDRAKEYLRTLDSGQRIARTNEKGERVYLEDAERKSETEKAKKLLAQCK
jgi:acyl-CoA reductase-like NAD-dependent aldehyde dehydrogenase